MKNIIIIILLMTFGKSEAQNLNEESLIGKWELNWIQSGFFPEEDLLFERTSKDLNDYIFELTRDGMILHQNNSSIKCPVGVFTLKDGNWKYENKSLTLELRGEKIADYWYWWIIKYKVEIQEDKMWLRVDEIVKNKQLPATATWEELIDEK